LDIVDTVSLNYYNSKNPLTGTDPNGHISGCINSGINPLKVRHGSKHVRGLNPE
jgi:hypothetical protein